MPQVQDFVRELYTKNLTLESEHINSKIRYNRHYDKIKTLCDEIEDYKQRIASLASLQSEVKAKDEEVEQLKLKIKKLESKISLINWKTKNVGLDQVKNDEPSIQKVI